MFMDAAKIKAQQDVRRRLRDAQLKHESLKVKFSNAVSYGAARETLNDLMAKVDEARKLCGKIQQEAGKLGVLR